MTASLRTLGVSASLLTFALCSSMLVPTAQAADSKGRPVTVRVVDTFGAPLPNAVVRVPKTEGTTRVNRNGEWTESMLYTIQGDEFAFGKNEWLVFNVSAPEYHARSVKYRVRGRKNYVEIALRAMPEPTAPLAEQGDQDLLIHWFQRTEIEGGPTVNSSTEAPK